ncbi:MAG: hypothetical protein LBQ12_10165 [Deltaproteobacteria bacterium]|jgi:hypothetical protein|nr:hypothetical protein [Deltaproteobacteria bacterium]
MPDALNYARTAAIAVAAVSISAFASMPLALAASVTIFRVSIQFLTVAQLSFPPAALSFRLV